MAELWIPASKAITIVEDTFALCSRLHAGLLTARAERLVIDRQERRGVLVPTTFWWAKGHAALDQNWQTGDFETWIDQKVHYQAFGVDIALSGILEMLPFEQRAQTARAFSVAGDPDWVPSRIALDLVHKTLKSADAEEDILDWARMGLLAGRAIKLEAQQLTITNDMIPWEQREWDIAPWFWNEFTRHGKSSRDWAAGRFSGSGIGPAAIRSAILVGVHFHRPSLAAMIGSDQATLDSHASKRGRNPKYDWIAASSAVWGRLYRGELKPSNQADIEDALIEALSKGDDAPGESTARPYAKPIWEQYQIP